MSLADELEVLLNELDRGRASGGVARTVSIRLADFLDANQDAILAALRGRDAVLEEAATITDNSDFRWEAADAIRAMKEGKQ